MSDYNFDEKDKDYGLTIRLDTITEQVKHLEAEADELGDKNAYLDMFQSEQFDKPQEEADDFQTTEPSRTSDSSKKTPTAYDAIRKKPDYRKSSFGSKKFYGLLSLLCVILAIFAFVFARNLVPNATDAVEDVIAEIDAVLETTTASYLVEKVSSNNTYTVYDTSEGDSITITVDNDTVFTSTKNTSMAVGDLVWLSLDENKLATKVSYDGITEIEETNLTVNTSTKTIQGENGTYSYSENPLFLYNGKEIQPQELKSCDVVMLYGVDNVIWSVEVLEYHGYFSILNPTTIENGVIEINDNMPMEMAAVDKFVLPEGKHTITISGDTIETTTDTIQIVAEQEYFYDLTNTQSKMGIVMVQTNVSEPRIYIDGALMDNAEAIVLPYGTYDLVILKNGYEEWNAPLTINEATLTTNITLTKIVSDIGVLSLTSNVAKGDVYIQGSYMGETPLDISLPYGSYHVEIEKRGYETYSTRIYINTSMIALNAELEED